MLGTDPHPDRDPANLPKGTAKMSDSTPVTFGALARQSLRILPEWPQLLRGAWNLATLSRDQHRSVGARLASLARSQPQRPFLRFEDRAWTYAEFNAWTNRCAAALRTRGIGSTQTVGILMDNRPEVLAALFGTIKLGAVAAMFNPQQRGEVLAHSITLSAPKILIVGTECLEAMQSLPESVALAACRLMHVGPGPCPDGYEDFETAIAMTADTDPAQTAEVTLGQACFHIYTSGTTGLPKASVMTHYRWFRSMAGLGQLSLRLRRDDVLYCALPLYHNNALTVSLGAVLGAGACLALDRKFSASRFWEQIRHHQATAFCYIGELCRYLLNRPPDPRDREHRVRAIIGNGLRPDIWDAFKTRFGIDYISEFYTASECNLAFSNGFGLDRTAGFCPLAYAIVQFDAQTETAPRDAEGRMTRVARGGTGLLITEISERAPFDGYTQASANDAKLLRDVFKPGDRWFNTGDLVRDQGWRHIQFVDRVGDTFRWKGENVATTQVEAAFVGIPGIEEAIVYGVEVPGSDGRAGMAALRLDGAGFDGLALADTLFARLPKYAVPLFIRLRVEQEVTSTFKYRKVDLKRQGFDPAEVGEPLYALFDRERGYEPLDGAAHTGILQGLRRPA